MNAINASQHSNVLREVLSGAIIFKIGEDWFNQFGNKVDLAKCGCAYEPLVPKKSFTVGDQVSFLEALESRKSFKYITAGNIYRYTGDKLLVWEVHAWKEIDRLIGEFSKFWYVICLDPVAAYTRCRVRHNTGNIYDVVKLPNASWGMYSKNIFFPDTQIVEILHVYNPKTEGWEPYEV